MKNQVQLIRNLIMTYIEKEGEFRIKIISL
jgi:hypothetical protein